MQETLRTIDGRSVLRMERSLEHPPEQVWRVLTESEHLAQWFPSDVEMEPKPGGAVRFVFREGEAPPSEGVVTEFDPPRVLAYTWFDNVLRYELHARGDECLLIFTHTFDDRAGAASFASGWQLCFDAMAQVLDARPVEIEPDKGALHEAYVARFGLDAGTSEETDEGWRVRFERQLTRPIEEVWARLGAAGTETPVVGGRVPHGFRVAEVPPGAITEVNGPGLLEYEWLTSDGPAGRVRWDLGEGTGHGARLKLTHTGSAKEIEARSTALAAWRDHIERFADRLLSPVAPPPAGPHGTLTATDDGRWALRFERTLAHPVRKVWRALTEREHLLVWFPSVVDLDLPAGTDIELRFPSGRASGSTGTITRADSPKLLEYTWDQDVLRWELTPTGDAGCHLAFTHVFDDHTGAAAAAAGWHAGLETLEAWLGGRDQDWSVWDRAAALQPSYDERFHAILGS
jgi:uncharacterized protein YndB with AHSA1/START domain